MNFGFTEEQELLRAELRKFLDQNASLEEVRRIVETPEGFSRDLWNRMAELGWVGLTLPEPHGGVGLDLVTLVVLLEEMGRTLFPAPFISTVLAAKAIERAGSEEQKARWLPGLADGSTIGAFAFLEAGDDHDPGSVALAAERDGDAFVVRGAKPFVPDAGEADLFVVALRVDGELALAVLEKAQDGVAASDYPSMDHTKRIGKLELDGVRFGRDCLLESGDVQDTLRWLLDAGSVMVTAEMVGSAEGALHITSEFAKQRVQFGKPIGQFQGVKHPLAEMVVDVESFKSLVYYASWALDHDEPEASRAASRAKAYATEAFARIGIDGVQLHGGVGYTDEYDIQLYLKRAKWARPMFGDADHHYDRLATLGGL